MMRQSSPSKQAPTGAVCLRRKRRFVQGVADGGKKTGVEKLGAATNEIDSRAPEKIGGEKKFRPS